MDRLALLEHKEPILTFKVGDRVIIEFEDGLVETYEIGQESDLLRDPPIITLESPLCKAIQGCKLGEWISFPSPKREGEIRVRVKKIIRRHS